jgi:hypothetical protein
MLNPQKPHRYDTDRFASMIWRKLLKDFRVLHGNQFGQQAEQHFNAGILEYRKYEYPTIGIARSAPRAIRALTVQRFKAYSQLESLLKKYRFGIDAYTDTELDELTLNKFFSEQTRIARHRPLKLSGYMVCQQARKIAKRILGSIDHESIVTNAKFGKKSSIGCPFSLAYIDHKLSDLKAFTGSSECAGWFFKEVIPNDRILGELVQGILKQGTPDLTHESLTLVNVPKTWKVHRTITPLTLLMLFYSYGIGQQVTERLADAGLDIRKLQTVHQRLVKGFSRSCSHATADLSAASDSLTKELLNRILPREWYVAIKKAMTHQLEYRVGDELYTAYSASVLPMGNGLTFPVETLIFYCIIKAIGTLTGIDGVFSVFGDDLIYPSRLHKYVVSIFPQLGLVLNLDKTFVKAPFRESCGSDYYCGCDVRPFFLRGKAQQLTKTQYLAYLYKTYNGLTRRWDPEEIRATLYSILVEIAQVTDSVFRVPESYPDTSGIRVDKPGTYPLGCKTLIWSPIYILMSGGPSISHVSRFSEKQKDKHGFPLLTKVKSNHQNNMGSRWYRFNFLQSTSKKRYIVDMKPYYWLSLQGLTDEPEDGNFWDTDFSYLSEIPTQPIQWEKVEYRRSYMRRGKRITCVKVKYKPYVASRESGGYRRKLTRQGSISDWI